MSKKTYLISWSVGRRSFTDYRYFGKFKSIEEATEAAEREKKRDEGSNVAELYYDLMEEEDNGEA